MYALCLPVAHRLHLTHVDTDVEGADAHFPRFDATQWSVTARESHPRDARHKLAFEFVDYLRSDAVAAGEDDPEAGSAWGSSGR